jgi:hypothetical protein
MKAELDVEEAWALMSLVVNRLAGEVTLPASDRAKVRRWRSEEMRLGSEAMHVLTHKINADLAAAVERKKRSSVRKPDYR